MAGNPLNTPDGLGAAARRCPERSLPLHRYRPGVESRTNRPADAAVRIGTSLRDAEISEVCVDEEFRFGFDLFNAGFYWEAHEAWEAVWIRCGRTGPISNAIKGLIKLAAASLKTIERNDAGACRHARRAAELLANGPFASGVELARRLIEQSVDRVNDGERLDLSLNLR